MFLFMPDLFAYSLCGAKSVDKTIASTSQMLDLENVEWQKDIFALSGKNEKFFRRLLTALLLSANTTASR
ncbi:MAG: FGGY family carbohydrate kinase [Eubacterium sp.]